jgi:hypothetical protein
VKENAETASEKAKKKDRMKSDSPMLKLRSHIRMRIGRDPEMNSPGFLGVTYK